MRLHVLRRRTSFVAVAASLVLVGCGVTSTPSGTPSSPSAGSRQSDLEPAAGWQLLVPVPRASSFSAVIAFDERFLVAGNTAQAGQQPLILRSADGLNWEREAIASDFGAPSELTVVGPRVIALGGGETGRCAHPVAFDTWARRDDGTWAEAPWVDRLCAGLAAGSIVDRTGVAYLLGVGSGDVPLAFRSADGLTWEDLGQPFELFATTAVADGATLWVFGQGPDGRPVAVRSEDGKTFARAALPGLPATARVAGAFVRGGALTLFVGDGPALERATRQPDESWETLPATGIVADEIARIVDLGDRFIGLGSDIDGRVVARVSTDGLSWARLPLPAGLERSMLLTGAAVAGGTAVLVGSVLLPDGGGRAAIWVGPAALLGG